MFYTVDCGISFKTCNNPKQQSQLMLVSVRKLNRLKHSLYRYFKLYEGDRVNLDRDVKKCEAKDAGCNQFIKVQPGTNLIGNSGFEEDADLSPSPLTIADGTSGYANKWYLKNSSTNSADLNAKIDQTTVHSGKNSLKIENGFGSNADFTQGLWLGDNTTAYSVFPAGFAFNSENHIPYRLGCI